MRKYYLSLITILLFSVAKAQISIPATTIITENFNSIGSSATAVLPANWKMSSAGTGATSNWATGTNITVTTQAASSGTPATGGAYNWATTAGTDRAIGFMTDGSYNSTNSILAWYRNSTGGTITTLSISFAIERYRTNTSPFTLSFFSSADGSTWTARTAGDVSAVTFATAASAYSFGAPQTVVKTVTITGLSIANNADLYLRWVLSTGNSNSQGLGLDNVSLYAGTATPSVMATMRDALTIDGGVINQANPGDQLTYTTTIKNTGTGDANNVNLTAPAPANTTLVGGSVKTSALARNDTYSTPFNTVLNGTTVLANDYGLPSVSLISFGQTANPGTVVNGTNNAATDNGGTVLVNTDGTFTYTPPAGFTGYDRFAYLAGTGTLPNNDAIVTITVGSAPVANNDSYNIVGNVSIAPNIAAGVLNNDAGTGITMIAVNGNSANVGAAITTGSGGNLTVNADGSFSYNPPAGFEGTDNFTYTIDNGFSAPVTATVTLNIAGMVWFIQNGGAAGDGRLSSPFNSIAAFQAVNNGTGNNPAANDNIFLYENASPYTGSLTLLNGQRLIGQDATVSLSSISGLTPNAVYSASFPAMNTAAPVTTLSTTIAATNAVNLGSGNTLRGFTIGNTTGSGISGNGFGTLVMSELSKNGSGQALALTTGTFGSPAVMDNITSSSSVNAISLSSCSGTLTVSGGSVSGATGAAFLINGGTVSVTYNGSISQANNAPLVSINTHTTGTVLFQTGTLIATGGTGVQFNDADGTYTFNGLVTLNGGDAGIDIITGSSGNFTFANAPITNPSGVGIVVNGANSTLTHSGAITKTSAGRLIDIQFKTGGSVTINGNLSSTVSSTGINVSGCTGGTITFAGTTKTLNTPGSNPVNLATNTGTTIHFTNGGLAITSTTATGFNTTGGGTITVQGSGNTISATTGTALNVVNTTIGAGGLTFQSISANGATTGILLDNTGATAGLTITGTGSTGTGGIVQNCVQRGARFLSCSNISLAWMTFTNNGTANIDPAATAGDCLNGLNTNAAAGIDLQTVSGVTINNTTITGGAQIGLNGKTVSNFTISNSSIQNAGNEVLEDGFQLSNLSGTSSITNCSFTGNFHRQFEVQNSTGTLNLTITGSTFDRLTYVSTSAQGILIAGRLTAVITASVKSSTFQNNFGSGFFGQSIDNSNVSLTVGSNGTSNIPAEGNTFTNNSLAFQIVSDNASTMNFNIGNNTHTVTATVTSGATPFSVRKGTNATGVSTGTIGYNTIGSATVQSGNNCAGCNGLTITNEGLSGGMNVTVRNNLIQHVNQRGMEAIMQLNDNMNITVVNNTIQSPDATIGQAIFGQSGNDATDAGTLCMEIQGNVIGGNWDTGVGVTRNIRLRQAPAGGPAVFRLRNLVGSTPTDVINYLNANNTNAQASATATGSFTGGAAACN